jgi:hypothetical protein
MRTVVFGRLGDPEFDPKFPTAYPVEGRVNILGEMPVRLRAEGKMLVAYGFGGQRVEIPPESVRQVWIHSEFEVPPERRVREALLVLDTKHHVLLKAPGAWGPGVREICQHLGLRKQPRCGSLSHGAALGNVIAGALAIAVAPPLARLVIRRFLAARRRVRDDFMTAPR